MPRQVREAVAWCISSDGSGDMPLDKAMGYVEEMFEDGRGRRELVAIPVYATRWVHPICVILS